MERLCSRLREIMRVYSWLGFIAFALLFATALGNNQFSDELILRIMNLSILLTMEWRKKNFTTFKEERSFF